MNGKKWIKIWILGVMFMPMLGILNYLVDPYQQYRIPEIYTVKYFNQRFQNPGLIKNYEYDSIALGASLMENFILSEVDQYLGYNRTLKVSLTGGTIKEQKISLNTVIDNKKIKNVFWCLDNVNFAGNMTELLYGNSSLPLYLYDDKIFNDIYYIFSLDVAKDSVNALLNKPLVINTDPYFSYDKMFQWQHKVPANSFSLENMYKVWKDTNINFTEKDRERHLFPVLKNNFDNNILNVVRINPDIKFTMFFPPYSILKYKSYEKQGVLREYLEFKKYMINTLLEFNNVIMYDFQIERKITHELSNYKDLSHYHQKINTWMLEKIYDKEYQVNKSNVKTNLENLIDQVHGYNLNEMLE
jgi:hypothetical protein